MSLCLRAFFALALLVLAGCQTPAYREISDEELMNRYEDFIGGYAADIDASTDVSERRIARGVRSPAVHADQGSPGLRVAATRSSSRPTKKARVSARAFLAVTLQGHRVIQGGRASMCTSSTRSGRWNGCALVPTKRNDTRRSALHGWPCGQVRTADPRCEVPVDRLSIRMSCIAVVKPRRPRIDDPGPSGGVSQDPRSGAYPPGSCGSRTHGGRYGRRPHTDRAVACGSGCRRDASCVSLV